MDQHRPDQPGGPGMEHDLGRVRSYDEAPPRRAGESGLPGMSPDPTAGMPLGHTGPALRPAGSDAGEREVRGTRAARELGQQARREGSRLAHEARGRAESALREGKDRFAEQVDVIGRALDDAANRLEVEQRGTASYAGQAAKQIHSVAEYLRDSDPRRMMRDIEGFARRRPEIFIGGMLVAGILLARFLRSSSPEDEYQDRHEGYGEGRGRINPSFERDRMGTEREGAGGLAGAGGGVPPTSWSANPYTTDPRVGRRGFEGDSGGA